MYFLSVLVACTTKDTAETETGHETGHETETETETETESETGLAIAGTYVDSWGGAHTIDEATWATDYGSYDLTTWDNDGRWLVAQNSPTNGYFPELWSRFDWTWDGEDRLWYCQTAYNAATEAAAIGTPAADPTDPATGGCGSFTWTELIPS